MPEMVEWVAHHLHCIFHSAVVASVVTLVICGLRRRFWWPLLGWWLHIVIDVFTHSAEFFPSPVVYPLSYWGFDGIPWNTPWFFAVNYAALALTWWWLLKQQKHQPPGD